MRDTMKTGLATGLLLVALFGAGGAETVSSGDAWFTNYTAESFQNLPRAAEVINPNKFDRDLMDAAVFHETNRRRKAEGLPPLAFDRRARGAAQMHSQAMARHSFVAHENAFDPAQKTVMDRARLAGLNPAFLAENVATTFAKDYAGGVNFYVRVENGRKVHSKEPNGPPIPMRTYLQAAEFVVNDWMNSPGHRRNILHKAATFLGCACEPARPRTDMETLYCTQVFYTPLRAR